MAGVKAALRQRMEAWGSDETLIELWGIMDDLWITDSGGLMLFRELRLPQPWEKALRRKGHTYWATSSGAAGAYDANGDTQGTVDVRLTVELPSTAPVDWDDIWETILELHERGENELRLVSGVPLIVRHVAVDGNDVRSRWIGQQLVS